MRELIRSKNTDAEEIMSIMEKLQHYVLNSCELFEIDRKFDHIQLSDGFIIVAEFDYINELCEILCQIQWKILINTTMLLRGALTAGKITISDDLKLIVGPAFIEAYALESENAIFPRIIIDSDLTKYLDKKDISFKYIREDTDHFSYLDFLGYEKDTENYSKQILNHILKTNGVNEKVKEQYLEYLNKNKKIAQKYGWLISKLKELGIRII
jgi:hypothetical protein